MPSVIKRSLTAPLLLALLAGCSGDTNPPNGSGTQPSSSAPTGGYGDILVDGKPVTGSKPSGNKKIPYRRTYTEGALYAPVTGYRSLGWSTSGLESVYEKSLTHRKGDDVETTVDPQAQKAAFEALGTRRGAAVALDVATGALLAVVSTPSYDPGAFSGYSFKDQEAWESTHEDENKPMLNRALREATAPGETFDIVIAASALDHGLYDTADEPVDGGSGECANTTIRTALARSCNEVFARLATDLGEERLRGTAEKFGFGDELFVPIRVAESTYESYRNGAVTVTPLQLARVTAALANRGLMASPHLVAEDKKAQGQIAQSVTAATAGLLLPAVREKRDWAPTATGGTPSSWSLVYARTGKGDTVALVARVATSDADTAARVTSAMAKALS